MGKKAKSGKSRKDKFYQLAKETGYRARSAFKLIQLNRKFEFLQKSRACIDLCAAPGGWLQVAQKYMPVSSVIIGVDLVPIKAIGNVITLQEDITTEKCRLGIKKALQTWKADLVMNDGAPNVGKNWLHDAFTQNQLTLSALKLACEFLNKGGNFVTKVFRSKDYQSLIWIFQQLFTKVHATKPQASRHESAEIFVVCEKYRAPDRIDEKFFDTQYVFKEIEEEPFSKLNIMHPEKQRRRAEGYAEGETVLFHQVHAIDFISGSNHIELLEKANEFVLNDILSNHSLTTDEIKECCKDIKVLGRREIRLILTWRKKMKEILEKSTVDNKEESMEIGENSESDDGEGEEEKVAKQIEKLQTEEALELKRKKRKVLKERRKLRDKMNLKMLIPNDEPIVQQDDSLFQIARIKSKKQLTEIEKGNIAFMDNQEVNDEINYSGGVPNKLYSRDQHIIDSDGVYSDMSDVDDAQINSLIKRRNKYAKEKKVKVALPNESETSENEEELSTPSSSEDEDNEKKEDVEKNPLVVDLEEDDKKEQRNKNIKMWFNKDIFKDFENENEEDLDLEILMEKNKKAAKSKVIQAAKIENEDSIDSEVEVVPQTQVAKPGKKKRIKLDPEGLALGSIMITSKKVKRDIIDASYNRYTFNDENLPSWFTDDEGKHCRKQVPVSKELINDYKEKLKEINARPIKKVAEAKARKKKRALRKMEKARKKAEAITETADMSEKEKVQQIRQLYKQAIKGKKKVEDKQVAYVVAKKGMGKKVRRPAGVTGKFKVVDPRMKKDNRVRKNREKSDRKRGKR